MNTHDTLKDAQRRWAEICATSDVGLWWIADDVRQLWPGAPEEQIRLETLRAIRPLLNDGSLRAVNLLPGGSYQPWEGSVDEHLARIDAEWAALKRPPDLGDIVWFIGTR
ncbi:hypothetical protein POL68_21715 [Stigmatella sp. ncwal1]|uniref:Uncharacterized protein n=1 Tax=Stigmatella ashevillensis TaxID=2995309 RepID=A0ABT5DBQ6_9BACT|nr:hypothetical protein [Stigmatella ashevillena]MDC0711102.1 hypothetical protein [Stigmatella ashevillena]